MVALTLEILVIAALVDSINPCVFGVLIFLIAYMTKVFKSKHRMLLVAAAYISVVYTTYFLLGLGILTAVQSLELTTAIYWLAAIIAIVAGLLEIKDFLWYGKGLSLQMIPGASKHLELYTSRIENLEKYHPLLSIAVAGMLGFFVVLVELPCTGAPYFAVIAMLSKGLLAQAIPLLLLYNLIFILPLFFIVGVAYFGATSKRMEKWRKKHRGLMRLGIGLFLIGLGLYMIYSILPANL